MKIVSTFWLRGKKYGTFRADSGEFETTLLEISEKTARTELRRANKRKELKK